MIKSKINGMKVQINQVDGLIYSISTGPPVHKGVPVCVYFHSTSYMKVMFQDAIKGSSFLESVY